MRIEVTRIFISGDPDDEVMQRIKAKNVDKRQWRLYTNLILAYGEYHLNKKFTNIYYTTGDEIIIDMSIEELDKLIETADVIEEQLEKETNEDTPTKQS